MSDTPLTDAESTKVWSEGNQGLGDEYAEEVVPTEFARSLERKIAQLEKQLEGYRKDNESWA